MNEWVELPEIKTMTNTRNKEIRTDRVGRRAGIMCSVVCGQCRGIGCSNSAQPDMSDGELDAHNS